MKSASVVTLFVLWTCCASLELKFELEDSRIDCFYEDIQIPGDNFDVVFYVIDGGNKDVDFEVLNPKKEILAKKVKKQSAEINLKAIEKGVYAFCFSNEFSSFSHKLVYFEFNTDSGNKALEQKSRDKKEKIEAAAKSTEVTMTSMESSIKYIIKNSQHSVKFLKLFRKWAWYSDWHAGNLLYNVNVNSAAIVSAVVIVSLVQTFALRRMFSDKKSSNKYENYISSSTL